MYEKRRNLEIKTELADCQSDTYFIGRERGMACSFPLRFYLYVVSLY